MLLKLGAGLLGAILALVSAGGIALFQGGIATVYVKTEELKLFLPVPMLAADLALAFMPDEERARIRSQLAPFRERVDDLFRELSHAPDAILVEVKESSERVEIRKSGNNFQVDVHSSSEGDVRVTVPIASTHRLVSRLAGSGPDTRQ